MLKNLKIVAFVGTLGHIGFLFLFMAMGIPELSIFNMFSILIWLCSFYTISKKLFGISVAMISFEIVLHATIVTAVIGTQAGFHYYLWPCMSLIILMPIKAKYVFSGLCFVLIAIFMWLSATYDGLDYIYEHPEILSILNMGNIFLSAATFIIIIKLLQSTRLSNDKRLFEMANMDDFTQTYNRRFIYALMGDANQIENKIKSYALVLADLDNFKRVNDDYGHAAGEEIILEVTKVIKASVGKNDIISRWSGQEFMLILNNTSRERVLSVLETIQLDLCRKVKKPSNDMADVTFSFGVALNYNAKRFAEALQRADFNLHKAKEAGKDRIVIDAGPI